MRKSQFLVQVEFDAQTHLVIEDARLLGLITVKLSHLFHLVTSGPTPNVTVAELMDASQLDLARLQSFRKNWRL